VFDSDDVFGRKMMTINLRGAQFMPSPAVIRINAVKQYGGQQFGPNYYDEFSPRTPQRRMTL
jgi:hypothetical protein